MTISRRDFGRIGGTALAAAFALRGGVAFAAARDEVIDPIDYIDPELRGAARQMLAMSANSPGFSDEAVAAMRAGAAAFAQPQLPEIPVAARQVPVGKRAPDVTVYVINSRPGEVRPGILHTHGGGYVIGQAKYELRFLQEMARDLDCVIVTVEYRLAPETRYTGSIEDNYAGLRWMHRNAAELGVDPAKIAVMGESAGGGHAALLALAARDRGEVPLVLQTLIYPMLDDRTGSTRAVPPHIGRVIWDSAANRYGWRSFLGMEPGGANVPAAAVPARRDDLAGLAPAFIATGGADLFMAEDVEYARRLAEQGVSAELLVIPRAFHAFDRVAIGTGPEKRFTRAKMNALRRAFGKPEV